jgi:integrase
MQLSAEEDDVLGGSSDIVDIIPAEAMQAIWEHCETLKEKVLWLLLRRCGMRRGAIVNLKLVGVTHHRFPQKVRELIKGHDKGNRVNQFVLDTETRHLMEEYLRTERRALKCNPYVFPTAKYLERPTAPMSGKSLGWMINNIASRAGVSGEFLHPHAFRKTYVTDLIEQGNDIAAVSKAVHHSSIVTTNTFYNKETYTHLMDRIKLPWRERPETVPHVQAINDATPSVTTDQMDHALAEANSEIQIDRLQELLAIAKRHLSVEGLARFKTESGSLEPIDNLMKWNG